VSVVRVRLSAQVVEFVRAQAPEPRSRLRCALRDLASEAGDIRPLEGPLQEYCRLRVGSYRILFRYATSKTIECVFVERRNVVYEVFAETLIERLSGQEEG
jgi:mRNA-degrading endonuclease RelE of RelBE toxin-antitoxin system